MTNTKRTPAWVKQADKDILYLINSSAPVRLWEQEADNDIRELLADE